MNLLKLKRNRQTQDVCKTTELTIMNLQKNKDKDSDSQRILNCRGNLYEPVKDKIVW